MVYLCNPNNPTGNLHSIDFIDEITKIFKDTLFLIDEAYFEFANITASKLVSKKKILSLVELFQKHLG